MRKRIINPIRLWARIITILYPVSFYIFFIRALLAVHIRGLDNFTLPIIAGLYLFLPVAIDAQRRWISWAWRTVRQFSTARRMVAILLIVAPITLDFMWIRAADALALYMAIAFVSALWGVPVEQGESTS